MILKDKGNGVTEESLDFFRAHRENLGKIVKVEMKKNSFVIRATPYVCAPLLPLNILPRGYKVARGIIDVAIFRGPQQID